MSTKGPPRGRAFIALWPPTAVAEQVARCAAAAASGSGRLVHAADLHLTLAFLGELAPAETSAAAEALRQTAGAAFELSLDRLGYFRRARVLWIGPDHTPQALLDLHALLWMRLESLGFEQERRPFRPHVTVARGTKGARSSALDQSIVWQADTLVLATSKPGSTQSPRYRKLAATTLGPAD